MPPVSNVSVSADNWDVISIPERLREAVDKGGGYNAIVRRSGVSQSSLNEYLKGRVLRIDTANRLADACGVSLQWLLFGTDQAVSSPPVHTPINDDIAHLDYYDVRASAGFGALNPDEMPEKVAVSRHFLRHDLGLSPDSALMLQVDGDSMEPTLSAGNRVIVDRSPRPALNGIHVLIFGGALLVKRLIMNLDGTVTVQSDNPIYAPQTVAISRFRWGKPDGNDSITVIGRVAYRLQAMS